MFKADVRPVGPCVSDCSGNPFCPLFFGQKDWNGKHARTPKYSIIKLNTLVILDIRTTIINFPSFFKSDILTSIKKGTFVKWLP